MARDIYEEECSDSIATRAARPSTPSYEDDELFERERTPKTSFATQSPFVAPAEIEGDRSPAIRARRASFVDHSEIQVARSMELATSAPEIEEVTKFAPPSRRTSRPAPRDQGQNEDRPLDYDALKLFLFEDGPDPGAADYVPAPTSRGSRSSRPSRSELASSRPPMASAHPEFEGPRGRQPMVSSHPDFEGPRGGFDGRGRIPSARVPMISSHPEFEGPRGAGRPQMFSSQPDFEGPRSMGRMPPRSMPSMPQQTTAQLAETVDRLPRVTAPPPPPAPPAPRFAAPPPVPVPAPPLPGARAPMPAMHPHTFGGGTLAMSMPLREETSPSADGSINSSWIVPTPPHTPRANRNLATGEFKLTLSFAAAALTAFAAFVVIIGAVIFVRDGGRASAMAQAQEGAGAAAETLPAAAPVAVVNITPANVAPLANANARADLIPGSPENGDAPKVAKKKPRKRPVVKPVVEEETEEEEAPPPPKTATKKTAKDKNTEKMLADLQEEQLRR